MSPNNLSNYFQIHRSCFLIILLIDIYVGASCCVLLLPFWFIWKFLLILFCLSAFYYQWRHHVSLVAKNSCVAISCDGRGKWYLYDQRRQIKTFLLQKSSVIWSCCLVLHFSEEGTSTFCAVVIFSDAMMASDFRRLKAIVHTGIK